MTEDEFFAALAGVKDKFVWRVGFDYFKTYIHGRRPDDEKCYCPIAAILYSAGQDVFSSQVIFMDKPLGLNSDLVKKITDANDGINGYDPLMREKILQTLRLKCPS